LSIPIIKIGATRQTLSIIITQKLDSNYFQDVIDVQSENFYLQLPTSFNVNQDNEQEKYYKIAQRFKYYYNDKYHYVFLKHHGTWSNAHRFMFVLVPEDDIINEITAKRLRYLSYNSKTPTSWTSDYSDYNTLVDNYQNKRDSYDLLTETYNFTFERLRPYVHFILNVDISNSGYDYIANGTEPIVYKNDGYSSSTSDIAFTRLDTTRTGLHEIFQAASFLNNSMLVLNTSDHFWYIDMPLTFTMWVNASYSTNDTCLFIISDIYDVNSVDGYVLSKSDNDDSTSYRIKHNDSIITDFLFNYNTWYHIGITFIRNNMKKTDNVDSGDFEMFVDGSTVTVNGGSSLFNLSDINSPSPGEFKTGNFGSKTHPVKKIVVGGGYNRNSWEGYVNDVRIYPTKLLPIEIGFVKQDIHVEGDDTRV